MGPLPLFSQPSIEMLSRAMDASHLRQQVLNHNIANVDTPFYQTKGVSFEEILQRKLNRKSSFQGYKTDPRHRTIGLSNDVQPVVTTTSGTQLNNNRNNVDIDAEMARLAKNGLWYQGLTQSLNHEFKQLRHVLTEGRG